MQVTITITGLDETNARLAALRGGLRDFGSAMAEIGEELKRYFSNDVFISRGGMYGQPWAALKQTTENEKERKYPGRGILVRSGAMQNSFISSPGPTEVYVTNEADYFKYHQLGTGFRGFGGKGVGRGRNLPQRQMIGVTPAITSIIEQVIQADVAAKLAEAGE